MKGLRVIAGSKLPVTVFWAAVYNRSVMLLLTASTEMTAMLR